MIIFRFNYFLLLFALSGCERSEDKSQAIKNSGPDIYEATVIATKEKIPIRRLVKEYEDNPNRFDLQYADVIWTVEGRIDVILPYLSEVHDAKGYFIPLKPFERESLDDQYLADARSRAEGASVDGVSVRLMNFSKEKAATLDDDELIKAKCKRLKVLSKSLNFEKCEIHQ